MTSPYHLGGSFAGFLVGRKSDTPARLVVTATALEVQPSEGGAALTLPWRSVELRRREGDGALVVRSRHGVAGSVDPELLRALESVAGNELSEQISRLSGQRTGIQASGWLGCLAFFGLTVLMLWSIPGCIRKGVDAAVETAPFSVDEQLGALAEGAMEVGAIVEDERVVGAMEVLVARLADAARASGEGPEVEWHVRVVRDATPNAFALPGGYITVFTGLIETATGPEMVAGVLAHEMAHVTERHGLRRLGQSLGFFASIQLLLGDTSGLASVVKEVLTIATVNDYSRTQETEADIVGGRLMHAADIDPTALANFFELLRQEHGDQPAAVNWLSTHPDLRRRIAAIRVLAAELGPREWEPLDLDWAAVRSGLHD